MPSTYRVMSIISQKKKLDKKFYHLEELTKNQIDF